jgi:hypothetical protein
MNKTEEAIIALTKFDGLTEAEKITGKSYKENDATGYLGFGMHVAKNEMLSKLLDEIGDTKFSNKVDEYITKLSKFGFEVVLCEPFENTHYKGVAENFYILFNKEIGVLIEFDTFGYDNDEIHNVNGGKIYYNWSPNDMNNRWNFTSSGSYVRNKFDNILFNSDLTPHKVDNKILPKEPKWKDGVSYEKYRLNYDKWHLLYNAYVAGNNLKYIWSGDHDCREAAITNIKRLNENGVLLTKWVECPFSWLLNSAEHSRVDDNFDDFHNRAIEITKRRIEKLPEYVRECIGNYKG